MENIDPAILQQFLQNNTEGTSQPFTLFPQELIDMFAMGIIALVVISALFLLVYLVGTIRKWKVQSAVLDIHKDVKQLKELLAPKSPSSPVKTNSVDKTE